MHTLYIVAVGIAGAAVGAALDPVGQRLADRSRAADDRRRVEREARSAEDAGAAVPSAPGAGVVPTAEVPVPGPVDPLAVDPVPGDPDPAPVHGQEHGHDQGHGHDHLHVPEHVVSDDTAGEPPDGVPEPVRHLLPAGHSTTRSGGAAALTGVLWAGAADRFGQHLVVTPFLAFLALAVAVSVTDLSHRLVPRTLLYGALAVIVPLLVVVSAVDGTWHDLVVAAAGGAAAFVVFFVIWFVMPRGMGFGDVRLAGVIGLTVGYLGLVHVYLAFLSGFVIGLLFGLAMMVGSSAGRRTRIPFAPALCAGAVIAILWGGSLANDLFHSSS